MSFDVTHSCVADYRTYSKILKPDGLINPCSMFPDLQFRNRKEGVQGFKKTRKSCDRCYVSIRASTQCSLWRSVSETAGVQLT